MWITTNHGKFLKRWKYQTTLPASCKTYIQVKKQQLEPDMEQWTGSKLGRSMSRLCCHSAYLTYMQSTSCGMLGWMKHKLKSRLPGDNNNLRYADYIPLIPQPLDEGEMRVEKLS